jgi:NTP pyrophosphatase (non-canonical NTP hydrolase)
MSVNLNLVLADIEIERERQEQLKARGRFDHTCFDPELTLTERFTILAEEVGEVAREVLTNDGKRLARDTEGTNQALYKELCQVAAIAAAWMEGMHARGEIK